MCKLWFTKAMKLVSEERGRQRDALALRVGELEAAKEKLVQQVYELKKAHTNLSSPTSKRIFKHWLILFMSCLT